MDERPDTKSVTVTESPGRKITTESNFTPLALQIVSGDADALVSWAWGVNGFFTVIGTVSALILGMAWGFKLVLLLGACCYVLALVALRISQRPRSA